MTFSFLIPLLACSSLLRTFGSVQELGFFEIFVIFISRHEEEPFGCYRSDLWMSPDLLITSEDGEEIKNKGSTLGWRQSRFVILAEDLAKVRRPQTNQFGLGFLIWNLISCALIFSDHFLSKVK